ncbi:hypothetical protein ACFLUR_04045 [Chloroflexota bacterium]
MKVLKLSRRTLIIVVVGILIIALAAVGLVYTQKVDEQTQLNRQLALKQSTLRGIQLEQLSTQQAELEKQVGQVTAELEVAKAPFSELAGGTPTISTFLEVAEANGLEVTEIRSPGPAEGGLGEVPSWVVPLTANVQGNTPDLVSFLLELDSSLVTGVIKSVTTVDNASAEIELVVYTYRGD